jgi:hypothetical protein
MARAIELMGIGMAAEEAIREGDLGPAYVSTSISGTQSTATVIGGPNGATILELAASAGAAFTFHPQTEIDRTYTIYAPGTTMTIFTPSAVSLFQTSATSFTIGSGKTAFVFRVGPIPFPTGSVATDRWLYQLSA